LLSSASIQRPLIANARPSSAKTDLLDAYLLAKHGRAEWTDLRRLDPDSPTIAQLQASTRDQESLMLALVAQLLPRLVHIAAYDKEMTELFLTPAASQIFASREAWAKDYYDRKRQEGKSHSMAVRALANGWVRIIYAMWVNKTSYQTATFEAARLAHAPGQHVA
jgi:Transposase